MKILKTNLIEKLKNPIDVKSSTYVDFDVDNNDKHPKYKIGDHIIISKYKNNLVNVYIGSWSEEVFVIKKVENIIPYTRIPYNRRP